jgi:hypothetical protein
MRREPLDVLLARRLDDQQVIDGWRLARLLPACLVHMDPFTSAGAEVGLTGTQARAALAAYAGWLLSAVGELPGAGIPAQREPFDQDQAVTR